MFIFLKAIIKEETEISYGMTRAFQWVANS